MSEKDSEKFESVGVSRVNDSRTPEPAKLAAANSAKEHLSNGRSYLLNGQFNEAITELSTAAFARSQTDGSPQSARRCL